MKNKRPLSWSSHREHCEHILAAALRAVDPAAAVARELQSKDGKLQIGEHIINLRAGARIFVVGAGKAGVAMAQAVERELGARILGGVVSVPDLPNGGLETIRLIQGGHPIPTAGSLAAGEAIRDLLSETRPSDLVLALISGGGSALLELPRGELSLQDLQATNDLLLKSGAPIGVLNTIRRQLSKIKGGGLLELAAPAQVAALILSDVVGDPLESIASGPTVEVASNPKDALEALQEYDLLEQIPGQVRALLEASRASRDTQTRQLPSAYNVLIGSNRTAALAAVKQAQGLGFSALLLTSSLQGEAREVGRMVAALTRGLRSGDPVLPLPAALVLGGETTVTVHGEGVGGRNQELALSAAMALEGEEHVAVMTLATDGVDGASPAAGAIVHGDTVLQGRARSLDPELALDENDSFPYLDALAATIKIGPTGTNVNDLVVCLAYDR